MLNARIYMIYFCLTHLPLNKMDAISQTPFSNAFSWMKMLEFRFNFHQHLFLRVQLQCGANPLPEPMLTQFIDAYMRHPLIIWGLLDWNSLCGGRHIMAYIHFPVWPLNCGKILSDYNYTNCMDISELNFLLKYWEGPELNPAYTNYVYSVMAAFL